MTASSVCWISDLPKKLGCRVDFPPCLAFSYVSRMDVPDLAPLASSLISRVFLLAIHRRLSSMVCQVITASFHGFPVTRRCDISVAVCGFSFDTSQCYKDPDAS